MLFFLSVSVSLLIFFMIWNIKTIRIILINWFYCGISLQLECGVECGMWNMKYETALILHFFCFSFTGINSNRLKVQAFNWNIVDMIDEILKLILVYFFFFSLQLSMYTTVLYGCLFFCLNSFKPIKNLKSYLSWFLS